MKKLYEIDRGVCLFPKNNLKLKLSVFFFLVALFSISANSFSQKNKITISVKNSSVINVLNEIESISDYRFIYKTKDIENNSKVSIDIKDKPIENVLSYLFDNKGVNYQVIGFQVALKTLGNTKQLNSIKQQQTKEQVVKGVVTDQNGLPLPAVNVFVKGTQRGTVTDFDGFYEMSISSEDTVLVFSSLGFEDQEIIIGGRDKIDVILKESIESLNEIVVQAYRSTTQESNTAAISAVSSKALENKPNISVINTLQAKVPGLTIGSGNGLPGFSPSVNIRGLGSINGSTRPLFIIDGTPTEGFQFRGLNPNDIESVSVLKDAAATAPYGNRGANGVIIITTKKGNYEQGLEIGFSTSYGKSFEQDSDLNLLDSRGLLTLQKQLGIGRGGQLSDIEIDVLARQNNTNWKDFIFQEGETRNYSLSISNGGKYSKVYTSIGYSSQEGILKNTGLERFSLTTNLSGKSKNDKFKYNVNYNGSFAESKIPFSIGTGFVFFNPIPSALYGQPFLSPFNVDGSLNDDTIASDADLPLSLSPFVILNNIRFDNGIDDKIIKNVANINTEIELLKGLSLKTSFGLDHNQTELLNVVDPRSSLRRFFPNNRASQQGRAIEVSTRTTSLNLNAALNYKKTFGEHKIDASVFAEDFRSFYKTFGFNQRGLDPRNFARGDGDSFVPGNREEEGEFPFIPEVQSNNLKGNLVSFFSIVDYEFKNKYGVQATVRRDGTFRFSPSNQWGTFYSISGRWSLDRENFLEGTAINTLKLRASYGKTGNQEVSTANNRGIPIFFRSAGVSRTLFNTQNGINNSQGLALTNLGNSAAQWETVNQLNIGVDYGIFNNRLRGSFDFYNKITEDLYISAPISAVNGQNTLFDNLGKLRNRGVDFSASYDLVSNNKLRLTLFGNLNYNDNEILDLNGGENDNTRTINRVGNSINAFFLVPYAGVNPANGNALYRDRVGNITETFNADDRVVINDGLPKYIGGFGFSADYKGFLLESNFSFVADYKRFNELQRFLENDPRRSLSQNVSANLLRAWTPDNRITDIEGLNSIQNNQGSDKFLQDASYVRLKSLTLAYNFNDELLKNLPISNFKIFVQGENLLTWTRWKGLDVESNIGRRFDFTQFPNPRIFTFGVDVKF